MASAAGALLERAIRPDLRIGRGILVPLVEDLDGRLAMVSQPEPLASLPPAVLGRVDETVMVGSLAHADLDALEAGLPPIDRVIGFGGGMVLDAAKYVAWRREIPLILAPSVISVDAAVTNTIAIRRGGVVAYEGFVVAEMIVADLELLRTAPARLNRAGVGDLLSIHTALIDWRLGAAAGRIAFDSAIAGEAAEVLERLYGLVAEVARVSDVALEAILRAYVRVNELCLRVGHSGPEEGSEHYLGYRLEALSGRSFVHGELIGLGTVLMARLQGNDPDRVSGFLDRCGVAWRPADQGLDGSLLRDALAGLPAFARDHRLPFSILDDVDLGPPEITRLLDGLVS